MEEFFNISLKLGTIHLFWTMKKGSTIHLFWNRGSKYYLLKLEIFKVCTKIMKYIFLFSNFLVIK